jgi:hypothetical protein
LISNVRHGIPGHENRTFYADTLWAMELGMSDVNTERTITGGMRPDKHPIRVAAILRDVCLQPLDHRRDVFAAVIPVLTWMPLHRDSDHVVLYGPASDVVVERIGFAILLLDLVAGATRNINENCAISSAPFPG